MKYEIVKAGEWIQPVRKGYKMRCCDCGLVHRVDFRVYKGKPQLRAWRDERATGQIRRHAKGNTFMTLSEVGAAFAEELGRAKENPFEASTNSRRA